MIRSWRSMLDESLAAARDEPTARYLQLATIGLDGRPANRTVVFRGLRPDSEDLLIATDARSSKVIEIERTPYVEACWYFVKTREQYRLGATVVRVKSDDTTYATSRMDLWQSLADAVRMQFTWPESGSDWVDERAFLASPPDREQPPDTFMLLVLNVETVDYLSLRNDPPLRLSFHPATNRSDCQRINP
jgi:pyridoxamine 5'-phosphate oxidase